MTWPSTIVCCGNSSFRAPRDAGAFVMEHRVDNNSNKCHQISILERLKAGSRYLDLRAWKAKDGLC
jgi:hypothetical protein